VAYFMDDWPALNSRRWLTGSVRDRARAILAQSDAWVMISEELRDSMIRRYGVSPKPTLVAHNPVDVDGQAAPVFMPRRSGRFRVVYAGTVQTMHADAILAVAEAIHRLRESGIDIEMVLHTPQWCERVYEEQWRRFGVVMGGLVPYADLNRVLRDADLLLVGLSFDPIVAHMAMYSLLTKITDYMATGVPILVCGPAGSASVNFAKRWDVALTCETKDVTRLAELIREQVSRPETNAALASRAWRCLQAQFSTAVVRNRLYSFLTRVARKQQIADCVG
jgi:glycosyltransferase involved in cell wall biosynthesis